jgi:hypothetical protein
MMVSRNQNHLQRHIEESLAERQEMLDWIGRAQALSSFVTVTERDWLTWGHLSPGEWLHESTHGPFTEDDLREDWEPEYQEEEQDDWIDEPPFGFEDLYDFEDDDPMVTPFDGQFYPAEDVRNNG